VYSFISFLFFFIDFAFLSNRPFYINLQFPSFDDSLKGFNKLNDMKKVEEYDELVVGEGKNSNSKSNAMGINFNVSWIRTTSYQKMLKKSESLLWKDLFSGSQEMIKTGSIPESQVSPLSSSSLVKISPTASAIALVEQHEQQNALAILPVLQELKNTKQKTEHLHPQEITREEKNHSTASKSHKTHH
jgi:hypothetical protein